MKKNLFYLFCILIGSIFVMTACLNDFEENKMLENKEMQEIGEKAYSQEANTGSKDSQSKTEASVSFNPENIKDLETAICNVIHDNWLIGGYAFSDDILFMILQEVTDGGFKFIFFDINTGQVVKEWKENRIVLPLECFVYDGEIVLYDSSLAAYIIAENANRMERLEIDEEICSSDMLRRNFCVIPKQRKIVYYKNDIEEFLYSCDFTGENKKQILKLESPETKMNYLNRFLNINAAADESMLYFNGYYSEDLKQQLKHCYGSLDFLSGDLEINYEEKGFSKLFQKGILFYDGLQEEKGTTGKVSILYDNKEKKEFSFPKKEESQMVYIDSDGNVLYSCQNDDPSGTTQINKYSVESGELVKSFELPIYTHDLILFEKKEIGFIYFHDKKENQWSLHAFSTN